jgi:transcriptional regulator with XRE-family HTH domain
MPRPRRWEPNHRLVYERERRGWSQDDAAREADRVADQLGLRGLTFIGAQFGRWERGEHRPRPPLLRVICELYEASAEELGLCEPRPSIVSSAAAAVATPERLGAVLSPPAPVQEAEPRTGEQGVTTTNRREAIKHAIVLGAGMVVEGRMLADAAAAAVAASRRWSASSVDAMTLETLDQDVEWFASAYHRTPHAQLFPAVWEDWLQVERLLDGRQSLKDRAHLTLLGGQLTYFLARLSFHMGDHAAARKHAVLIRKSTVSGQAAAPGAA